jgi:hypothetical protein
MLSTSPPKKYTLGADDGEAGTNTLPKAMCQNVFKYEKNARKIIIYILYVKFII